MVVCGWCGGVPVVCLWCVGGGSVVCWWCVGGVLVVCWWCVAWGGVAPCGLVVRGVGVVVSMYVCVAWGLLPHGVVGVLVVWWFGDWWCVWCWCVGVCVALIGACTHGGLMCWCCGVLVPMNVCS